MVEIVKKKANIKPAFLYVEGHQLTFADAEGTLIAGSLSLTSEVVKDLTVVNQKQLEKNISDWLEQAKIAPKQLVVLLAESVTFSKSFSGGIPKEDTIELVDFLHLVPFENQVSKTFPTSKGSRLVVMNRDLFTPLLLILNSIGFSIIAVSPAFSLGIAALETGFTTEAAQIASSKVQIFLHYNYLSPEEVNEKLNPPEPFLSVKFDVKLYAMIGIFVALLITLGLLLFFQR